MKVYKGSCHCGAVQYEVSGDFNSGMECNCSICSKKGTVLTFTPAEHFKLISGADSLTHYRFHKKVIDHTFCNHCGVTAFATGQDQNGNEIKAINLRCIDGLDLKSLNIKQVDGRSF